MCNAIMRRKKVAAQRRQTTYTVVHSLAADLVERDNVVVSHVILISVVVELYIRLPVMARINIDLTVKDMRRRVGGINVSHQRFGRHDEHYSSSEQLAQFLRVFYGQPPRTSWLSCPLYMIAGWISVPSPNYGIYPRTQSATGKTISRRVSEYCAVNTRCARRMTSIISDSGLGIQVLMIKPDQHAKAASRGHA